MLDEKFAQGLDILIQKYPSRFLELVCGGDISFGDKSPTITSEAYRELIELAEAEKNQTAEPI